MKPEAKPDAWERILSSRPFCVLSEQADKVALLCSIVVAWMLVLLEVNLLGVFAVLLLLLPVQLWLFDRFGS